VEDHLDFEADCEPDPNDANAYARTMDLFDGLYERLRPAFKELAALESGA
jgi:hypothetical protein